MTKRRIAVMVAVSPVLIGLLVAVVLASAIIYAVTGKWELRQNMQEIFGR